MPALRWKPEQGEIARCTYQEVVSPEGPDGPHYSPAEWDRKMIRERLDAIEKLLAQLVTMLQLKKETP